MRSPKRFSYDRRNSISKLPLIIKNLREGGYKDGDEIPHEDVVYYIRMERGLDPRTVTKYVDLLLQLHYLEPATKVPVKRVSKYRVTTPSSIETKAKTIMVDVDVGFKAYVFGNYAPNLYQETLNPKYVPPASPPSERVRESSTLPQCSNEQSRNNMCVERSETVRLKQGPKHGDITPSIDGIEREEREIYPRTHILNSVIAAECGFIEIEANGQAVCTVVFWNGTVARSVHRPLTSAEVVLCKTRFKECPDYQARMESV